MGAYGLTLDCRAMIGHSRASKPLAETPSMAPNVTNRGPMSLSTFLARAVKPVLREHQRLKRKMKRAGLREQTVSVPQGTIRMWVGDGPPERTLILLQGFGGSATWQWYPQAKALNQRCRLILPDLLYFGESTSAMDDYSIEHQVDALHQVFLTLGLDRFDLGGLSYGGLVALRYAAAHPQRVGKLVVTSSPGPTMTHADLQDALCRLEARTVEQVFVPKGPDEVRRLLKLAWYKPPWAPHFALLDAHQRLFSNQTEAKRRLLAHIIGRIGDEEVLQLDVPHQTLLIWGQHDALFPVNVGRRLAEHMGEAARLHIIDKAAHCPNLERPKQWNKLVLDFLELSQTA